MEPAGRQARRHAAEAICSAFRRPSSILDRLSSVEVIQVDEVPWTPGSPLHAPQVLECTYRNRHARHFDVDGPCSKLVVRQDTLKTLDDIQIPELRSDQRPFAAMQQRRNGALRAEQRLSQLDASTELVHDMGKPVEVFRCRIGHDVAILRSADDAPRSQRQASNNDEANISLDDADEKLVERRSTQRARRAESRNSNSLRVNEIVSLRLTTSGRCPSARRRSRRTRSPSESRGLCVSCSAIDPNIIRAHDLRTRKWARIGLD
jgi:hypothetical protein